MDCCPDPSTLIRRPAPDTPIICQDAHTPLNSAPAKGWQRSNRRHAFSGTSRTITESIRYTVCVANMIKKLARELVRRGVLRALGAYIVIVWLLAQGLVDLFPAMGLPEWSIRVFLAIAVTGTPVVAVLAWRYDLTSKGLLRDRVDVASARRSSPILGTSPTRRPGSRRDDGSSIVHASWTNDKGEACECEFYTAFVVGRDFQADVRLWDDRVSRRHTQVYPVGDEWYVKDLTSLNGTYVDGQIIDVRKIEADVEVSLDKKGPIVRLAIRMADETAVTVDSA